MRDFDSGCVGIASHTCVRAGKSKEAGKTPVDRLIDGPYSVQTATGTWTPANFGNQYFGDVTLMSALAFSLNTISVQLAVQVGLDRIIEIMRGYGITSPIPRHISISLGTPDLTPIEIAAGYAGIANGGRRVTPRFFDLVTSAGGRFELQHPGNGVQCRGNPHRALDGLARHAVFAQLPLMRGHAGPAAVDGRHRERQQLEIQ